MHITIIGAGLAGLGAAWALQQAGVGPLTVLERREGPGLETSFANGALLHPSLVQPWNHPGVLGELLRSLGREDAAALLRLRALPSLGRWGWHFLRQSSPPRFEANTRANLALARDSVARMAALREAGIRYQAHASGSLLLMRDPAALEAAVAEAARYAADGLRSTPWTVRQVLQHEPALAPLAGELAGALFHPDDERGDAHAFCTGLAATLQARGVRLEYGAEVRRIATAGGRVSGLLLADGQTVPADAVVLAAAAPGVALAAPLGLALPVRPAKGYSVTLPLAAARRAGVVLPHTPVVDAALHVAVVPVGDEHLRVAGTAEFAGMDLRLKPARVANLQRLLARVMPAVCAAVPAEQARPWTALRPMTPDGVPLVGATRVPGLWLNTGHGHLGWTQAAGSGALLADLLLGRRPALNPAPYAPARWGLGA